jgi:hypothetical protein
MSTDGPRWSDSRVANAGGKCRRRQTVTGHLYYPSSVEVGEAHHLDAPPSRLLFDGGDRTCHAGTQRLLSTDPEFTETDRLSNDIEEVGGTCRKVILSEV